MATKYKEFVVYDMHHRKMGVFHASTARGAINKAANQMKQYWGARKI